MEMRCVWIMYIVLLAITIQKTTSVRLVVLRENADSVSEEDKKETLSEEESEEIDFLMDLIESEAKERDPPPVTTVRLIKQIAEHSVPKSEHVPQQSVRKERHESRPNSFKEYHVHYHNHQHKGPSKPIMGFDDSVHPYIWSSQFPVADLDVFRQLSRNPLQTFPEKVKMKDFKHFDAFAKTHPRYSPYPSDIKNLDPKTRLEAFKDFETLIKPRIPTYKSNIGTPFERMKTFQEYYDSEEEKASLGNKDRFAGFKDFSDLENADGSSQKEEKGNTEKLEKKTVKVRDFAIVIKSRPRKTQNKEHDIKEMHEDQDDSPGPHIPPFVNRLRIPHDPMFGVPRILDAAGGAPKYIDALNKMKYPQPDFLNMPMGFPLSNLNALESEHRKLLRLRAPFLPPPMQLHSRPHYPLKNNLNGWLLRRLLR